MSLTYKEKQKVVLILRNMRRLLDSPDHFYPFDGNVGGEILLRLSRAIREYVKNRSFHFTAEARIIEFNDSDDVTHEDIVNVLDLAIEKAEQDFMPEFMSHD